MHRWLIAILFTFYCDFSKTQSCPPADHEDHGHSKLLKPRDVWMNAPFHSYEESEPQENIHQSEIQEKVENEFYSEHHGRGHHGWNDGNYGEDHGYRKDSHGNSQEYYGDGGGHFGDGNKDHGDDHEYGREYHHDVPGHYGDQNGQGNYEGDRDHYKGHNEDSLEEYGNDHEYSGGHYYDGHGHREDDQLYHDIIQLLLSGQLRLKHVHHHIHDHFIHFPKDDDEHGDFSEEGKIDPRNRGHDEHVDRDRNHGDGEGDESYGTKPDFNGDDLFWKWG